MDEKTAIVCNKGQQRGPIGCQSVEKEERHDRYRKTGQRGFKRHADPACHDRRASEAERADDREHFVHAAYGAQKPQKGRNDDAGAYGRKAITEARRKLRHEGGKRAFDAVGVLRQERFLRRSS